MTLQEVTAWLRSVEDMACSVYAEAAASAAASVELAGFLRALAEDEALHYHLLGSAAELMRSQGAALPSAVLVDAETRDRLEAPLRELHAQFQRGQLTERLILERVVALESSEWNDIFVYVTSHGVERSRCFQYVASVIQAHEKRIEAFLATQPAHADLAGKLSALPGIWRKQLLVVDDEPALRALLVRALSRYGEVTAAENGEAALAQIRNAFFDVVVTDVVMPVRDGISLLREAIAQDPVWRAHFIVCTGNATAEVRQITKENGVPLLVKPMSIQQLRAAVEGVLAGRAVT